MTLSQRITLIVAMFAFVLSVEMKQPQAQESPGDVISAIEAKRGIILTKEARAYVRRSVNYMSRFGHHGMFPDGPGGSTGPNPSVIIDGHQEQAFDGGTKTSYFFDYAREIADIHIVVLPVPPRNYSVYINGTRYEASKLSKYGYPPGMVEVIVKRIGKADCKFFGELKLPGYEMRCRM